tara:strand:- start:682 stop:906 length:225 start_codon:yes stop_codon:yes gene_type:complete
MKDKLIEEIRNSLCNIWQFNNEGNTKNLQKEINYIRRLVRKEELKKICKHDRSVTNRICDDCGSLITYVPDNKL